VVIERLSGKDEGIVQVYLNRVSKMNGLDVPMFDAIAAAAKELRADRGVRVVILSGRGRAFCTGLDIKSVMANPINFSKLLRKPSGTPVSNLAQDVGYLWRQLPCPVIAAVHGMCFGGGEKRKRSCWLCKLVFIIKSKQ
jgi:enoyl-CoA hydratase/carnithine racemase